MHDFGGGFPGLGGGTAGGNVALLRRAKDEHFAAELGAAVDQIEQVLGGAGADVGVGVVELETFGLRQQPVETDDGKAGALDGAPDAEAVGGGEIGDKVAEGEGRQFEALVAKVGDEGGGLVQGPVFEELVADGVGHGGVILALCRLAYCWETGVRPRP